MKLPEIPSDAELRRRRLDALSRAAYDLAREWLADSPEMPRSSKAVRLAVYRSLRRLKACEAALRAEFIERGMQPGVSELDAYAAALASLPLAPVVTGLLQRALRSTLDPQDAPLPAATDVSREQGFEAWSAVARALADLPAADLPPLVRRLLCRPWAQYMASIALRDGSDGAEFRYAAAVAGNLRDAFTGWSMLPHCKSRRAQQAMHRLAESAIDLRNGLEQVGYGSAQIVEVWHALTRLVVGAASDDGRLEGVVVEAGHDLESALRHYAPAAASVPTTAPVLPRVGTLFDWHTPDAGTTRLKLCWRSPVDGWHVFVNAAGVKTLELPLRRVLLCLESAALVPVPGG